MLDAVVAYLPSPLDVPAIKGIDPSTDEEVERHSSDEEPFSALAFKVMTDPFVGNLLSSVYTQVYFHLDHTLKTQLKVNVNV